MPSIPRRNQPTARALKRPDGNAPLLGGDYEVAASVLCPTRFARRRAEWRLSAESHRLDSVGADSQARQIVSNRYRPLIAKREVVFRCPALAAMSVDAGLCLRPFPQPLRVSLQH